MSNINRLAYPQCSFTPINVPRFCALLRELPNFDPTRITRIETGLSDGFRIGLASPLARPRVNVRNPPPTDAPSGLRIAQHILDEVAAGRLPFIAA